MSDTQEGVRSDVIVKIGDERYDLFDPKFPATERDAFIDTMFDDRINSEQVSELRRLVKQLCESVAQYNEAFEAGEVDADLGDEA